uniref:Uncharacterized protein n=1 Tax=Ixodes ricinus TaxID=34613 RepID=A0A6B0UGF4_IXORI
MAQGGRDKGTKKHRRSACPVCLFVFLSRLFCAIFNMNVPYQLAQQTKLLRQEAPVLSSVFLRCPRLFALLGLLFSISDMYAKARRNKTCTIIYFFCVCLKHVASH